MTKPVWSHVLALSAWTFFEESSYSQMPENLSPDYKYRARNATNHSLPNHT